MESSQTVISFFLIISAFVLLVRSHEEINRNQFPGDFFFGVATSSFQIEGAVSEDGRGVSNWDVFSHIPGNIKDGTDADVADDHYHLYKEDVDLMGSLGVNSYRFSIAWTRILPKGRFGEVNPMGITFYNTLIDSLLQKGIEPFVTLSHSDLPQELEDRYQSWLSPIMQDEFVYYADLCFKLFGDRVKYWITINEPNLFATVAYFEGLYPPGRCSQAAGNCSAGNSEIEPFIAAHNMILAHAKAANTYKRNYQSIQGGHILIVPHAVMYLPISDEEADQEAAKRATALSAPWILDPIVFGDYPPEMRQCLGDHLPKFTPAEKILLKSSLDFIGINHYSTLYAKDCMNSTCGSGRYSIEGLVYATVTDEKNGIPIGEPTQFPSFYVVPDGMEKLLDYLKTRYNNVPMFILENGFAQENKPLELNESLLNDTERTNYHKSYIAAVKRAMKNGADIRGYFVWSLLDNFEWISGFRYRFGLYYVDHQTQKRIPKSSAKWYKEFLTSKQKRDQKLIKVGTVNEGTSTM